jgi:hypothetical protein
MRQPVIPFRDDFDGGMMSKIVKTLDFVRDSVHDLYRFLKGGEPTPEAVNSLAEFLSDREDLPPERWVSEICPSPRLSGETVVFAHEFFVSMGIPFGKVRPGDRLKDDLHIRETLQDDWDYDLQQAFKERFGKRIVFRKGSPGVSVADLLLFLQAAIDEGRNELPQDSTHQ